ncbi:MAG: hypothetical protein E6R03_15980 [Hyphomicrobiaceae bacterium]|nr:MAG: hypothetical protein E6R03_15980 [Hyphomicrobiaceae bacterium]
MQIVTTLSVTTIEGALREPRGILNVAHVEPAPGVHVKAMLGSAGLVFRRGNASVCYPLELLIRAAAQQYPELLQSGSPSAVVSQIAAAEAVKAEKS